MRVSAESRRYIYFLLGVCVCVVFLALPSMDDIDVTWEHLNWNAAMAIRETGVPFVRPGYPPDLHHPPSWSYIIAASVSVFGESVWAMRLPGLLCFLTTGLLLYACARCLSLNRLVATLAATIYLTNPMALQGALNMDYADGQLLPLASVSMVIAYLYTERRPVWLQGVWLGLGVIVLLWAKLTSTAIFLFALALVAAFSFRKRNLQVVAAALGTGLPLTLLTWGGYCLFVKRSPIGRDQSYWEMFGQPVDYLVNGKASAGIWSLEPSAMLLHICRITTYAGPVFMALAVCGLTVWGFGSLRRLQQRRASLIPVYTFGVLLGYTLFVGGTGPFPKYYAPAFPFIALFCAMLFTGVSTVKLWQPSARPDEATGGELPRGPDWSGRMIAWLIAVVALLTAYYVLIVGDNVYRLNYVLKEAMLVDQPRPALAAYAIGMLLCLLPFAAAIVAGQVRRSRALSGRGLLAALIASQLGLLVVQARGDYSLRYLYGTPMADLHAVRSELQKLPPLATVMGEAMYATTAGQRVSPGYSNELWQSIDAGIVPYIEAVCPDAVVYGLMSSELSLLRRLPDHEPFNALMHEAYDLQQIGGIYLWVRREGATARQ